MSISIDFESVRDTSAHLHRQASDLATADTSAEMSGAPGAEGFDAAFTSWAAGTRAMVQEMSARMSRHGDGLTRTADDFMAIEDGLSEGLHRVQRVVTS